MVYIGYLLTFISTFTLLFATYKVVTTCFKKYNIDVNLIYFSQHAIYNTVLIYMVKDDIISSVQDPLACYIPWSGGRSFVTVMAFHLYHIVLKKSKLEKNEWFHHVFFCIIVPPISLLLAPYNITNLSLLFLIGLPGAVSYSLLVFSKLKIIHTLTEKRISRLFYLWFRMPGCIIIAFLIIIHVTYCTEHNNKFNHLIASIISLSICWNGIYYADAYSWSYKKLLLN